MVRPTGVLTCYRTRRRLGAWLDGALDERTAAVATAHVARCPRCEREVDGLRRLRALLARSGALHAPDDWTGFWEGVVRGVEDGRRPVRSRAGPAWLRPRLAATGAVAVAVVVSLTLWQALSPSPPPVAPIVVSSADTEHPEGTIMVYEPPEKDLAVVWVFGLE